MKRSVCLSHQSDIRVISVSDHCSSPRSTPPRVRSGEGHGPTSDRPQLEGDDFGLNPRGSQYSLTMNALTSVATVAPNVWTHVATTYDLYNRALSQAEIAQAMSPITVTVSPASGRIYGGQQAAFTATLANTGVLATGVTWSLGTGAPGSINAAGVYQAPASVSSTQQIAIVAASAADRVENGYGVDDAIHTGGGEHRRAGRDVAVANTTVDSNREQCGQHGRHLDDGIGARGDQCIWSVHLTVRGERYHHGNSAGDECAGPDEIGHGDGDDQPVGRGDTLSVLRFGPHDDGESGTLGNERVGNGYPGRNHCRCGVRRRVGDLASGDSGRDERLRSESDGTPDESDQQRDSLILGAGAGQRQRHVGAIPTGAGRAGYALRFYDGQPLVVHGLRRDHVSSKMVNGSVTVLSQFPFPCHDGMTMGMVVRDVAGAGTQITLSVDSAYTSTVTDNSSPITSGKPGVSLMPATGTTISKVEIGNIDRAAPGVVSGGGVSAFANRVELQWQAAADDNGGSGVVGYQISRGSTYLGMAGGTQYTDETGTVADRTAYTITAVDRHGNSGAGTTLTAPAVSADSRRIGVRPTGAYWGAAGEQIDLLSGNLNFALPLIKAQSRGGWAPRSC